MNGNEARQGALRTEIWLLGAHETLEGNLLENTPGTGDWHAQAEPGTRQTAVKGGEAPEFANRV